MYEVPGAEETHGSSFREKITETGFEPGHLVPWLVEGREVGMKSLQELVFFGGLWSYPGGSLVSATPHP